MQEPSKRQWKNLYQEKIQLKQCYCYLCGKLIEKSKDFSLDHGTPLSRGGSNTVDNFYPTHKKCNSDKGALTYAEWILYQELIKKKNGRVK